MKTIATPDTGLGELRRHSGLLLAAAIGFVLSVTHFYTIGVFIGPVEQSTGWSRTEISFGITLTSLASIALAPFAGRLIDRRGVRKLAIFGTLGYCASIASFGFVGPSILSWWACFVLLAISAVCTNATVWTAAVARTIHHHRGMAIAFVLCGGSIGQAVLPIASQELITAFGWRMAYVVLAAAAAVLITPLLVWKLHPAPLANAEPQIEQMRRPSMPREMLTGRYIRLAAACLALSTAMNAMTVHFVPMLIWKGLSPLASASIAGTIGLSSLFARLTTGYLLDRVSGPLVAAVAFAMPLAPCAILAFGGGGGLTIYFAAAILTGMSLGADVDVIAYMTSRYFRLEDYGSLFGVMASVMAMGLATGPLIAGAVYDHTQSYEGALAIFAALFVVSVGLVGGLGAYPEGSSPPQDRIKPSH